MRKFLLFLIAAATLSLHAAAQKKGDTTIFYLKSSGEITRDKREAAFVGILLPYDRSAKSYPFYLYFTSGQKKLLGSTRSKPVQNKLLLLDGSCTYYYPNGKRQKTAFYKEGNITGDYEEYYPNGKLHCVKSEVKSKPALFIECRDSTGKILAEDGKGYWVEFNEAFNRVTMEGNVKDSLQNGEWHGPVGDTGRFVCTYQKGIITSGTGNDAAGKAYSFTSFSTMPVYKGGDAAFRSYMRSNTNALLIAPAHLHIYGMLHVHFTVEKDGTITHVGMAEQYVDGNDGSLNDYFHKISLEIVKAIKASPPWVPGTICGMPQKVKMSVPIDINTEH